MLFHKLGVAALVLVATIAIATAGLHAKAHFGISGRAGTTKGTHFIARAIVLGSVFGRRVTNTI